MTTNNGAGGISERLRHAFDYQDDIDGDYARQVAREFADEIAALQAYREHARR